LNSNQTKRAAALLVNEWICVTGQYEKAMNRLGRELYQCYKAGQLSDEEASEYCRVLDGIFNQAKSLRTELKFDLHNAVNNRARAKNAHVQRAKSKIGGVFTIGVLQYWDQLNIPKYKEAASGTILALSNRALGCADRGDPLIDSSSHERLCKLALALEKECQTSWKRLVELRQGDKGSKSLSLATITVNLFMGIGRFAKKSKYTQKIAKLMKYNERVEISKLLSRFAGRPEEYALREQLGFA